MVFGGKLRALLPYINFGVACTALMFQVAVLYPWHMVLEKEMENLQKQQTDKLKEFHELKWQRLTHIEAKLEALVQKSNLSMSNQPPASATSTPSLAI